MIKDAYIPEDDQRYRYWLLREWDSTKGRVCFGLLNPSKADHRIDDPTVKKGIKFSQSWGFGSMMYVNVFAWRATDPKDLTRVADPVGPENDKHVLEAVLEAVLGADLVIAAWGASYPKGTERQVAKMRSLFESCDAHVLGLTKAGDPRHPLYMRDDSLPIQWARAA